MAVSKYLGENGLTFLMTLIKNQFANFVAKEKKTNDSSNYKVLTDNNLSDELKGQYDVAYTHSQADHAPANAQENVIEAVKVNTTPVTVDPDKSINISVPLVSTSIETDSGSNYKAASPKAVVEYVTGKLASLVGLNIVILKDNEYDADTKIPTISEPQTGTFYFVPTGSGTDTYKEFIYYSGAFELIGSTDVDLTGYLKTTDFADFDNDEILAAWSGTNA